MGNVCTNSNAIQTDNTSNPVRVTGNNKIHTLIRNPTSKEEFEEKNFKSTMLDLHNELRKKYNSPELKVNDDLNLIAEEYAKNLTLNEKNIINIYNETYLGENVVITEKKNDAKEIFAKLSEESQNYDFEKNKFSKNKSHFTQIIWKETKEIGIGFSYNKVNKQFCTVILYYPPGNILGEFAKNVSN